MPYARIKPDYEGKRQTMDLAIDIGGSKTLAAVFGANGQIIRQEKFVTPKTYKKFLAQLAPALQQLLQGVMPVKTVCAVPGLVDRKKGVALSFGNLPWHHLPIKNDVAEIVGSPNIFIENDANLAGLSEAALVINKYKRVLYLTISTGIGDGFIINGIIDPTFADSEAGQMVLEHDGKLRKWEDFASGRALSEKYGKLASEINDERVWYKFVKGLAQGIDVLVATLTPEVIIIGGGVGAHFDKFGHFLVHELKKYENNMVKMPPVVPASRAEEAVIYGCYEYAKQQG